MTESELSTLVSLAQHSRNRKASEGLIACRGEMEGQVGVVVYTFADRKRAAAFHVKRQIEAHPFRLEILDSKPNEVRELVL